MIINSKIQKIENPAWAAVDAEKFSIAGIKYIDARIANVPMTM
jgi:hypothetical protein